MMTPEMKNETKFDKQRERVTRYFGENRYTERRTFDHFHKSFPLSPVPPHLFQNEDTNGAPEEHDPTFAQPGLYIPHPMKWIPDWGYRKQLAAIMDLNI
eukprot:UN28106